MLSELSKEIGYDIHKLLRHNDVVSLLGHYYYKMVDENIDFYNITTVLLILLKTADKN